MCDSRGITSPGLRNDDPTMGVGRRTRLEKCRTPATTKELKGVLPNYTSEMKYLIGGGGGGGGGGVLYSFKNSASLFNEDECQGRSHQ